MDVRAKQRLSYQRVLLTQTGLVAVSPHVNSIVGRLLLCGHKTNMDEAKINFAELSWDESNVGIRSKAVVRNGKKLRLVEFTSEFVEYDWCITGHI